MRGRLQLSLQISVEEEGMSLLREPREKSIKTSNNILRMKIGCVYVCVYK